MVANGDNVIQSRQVVGDVLILRKQIAEALRDQFVVEIESRKDVFANSGTIDLQVCDRI